MIVKRLTVGAISLALAGSAAAAGPSRAVLQEGSIGADDYPLESVRNAEEGTSVVRYTIGKSGRPTSCAVSQSSGSVHLDNRSCLLIMQRFRFEPAKNAEGVAIEETRQQRVNWALPKTETSEMQLLFDIAPSRLEFEVIVSPDGRMKACKVIKAEGRMGAVPLAPCPPDIASKKFAPFPGPKDKRFLFVTDIAVDFVEP